MLVFSTSIAVGVDGLDAVVSGLVSRSSALGVVDGLGGRMSGKRGKSVAEPFPGDGSRELSVELE